MDIPAVFKKTFYYLSDEEKEFMDLFLERHSITGKEQVIAVAPGGGESAKRMMLTRHWPVQNYIELIQRLKNDERSSRVILVGGTDDREITNRIIQICPDCLDATDLSLGDMASIFRRCSLFIGDDYARNHIAVATGIPSIRILGPADSRPATSFDMVMVNDASAAPGKANPSLGGKFSKYSSTEFPVAVSVDEVWRHLKTLGGYCQ